MSCSVANTNNVFLNNYTKGELTALMQVSQAGNFYIPESCPKGSGSWACERCVQAMQSSPTSLASRTMKLGKTS